MRVEFERVHDRVPNGCLQRLRLFGAAGGALAAVVALASFLIAPGPSSARGATVVAYYSAHSTAVFWQATLAGIAFILFIWFAETFASAISGSLGLIGAAVTATLYLVAIGCWEVLGEIYGASGGTDLDEGDAHAVYAAGIGAAHLAHFTTVAYVASIAVAILAAPAPQRLLGWIGAGFALVCLVSAVIVLESQSHWSDVVGAIVFLAFLLWVFATSVWLALTMRRDASHPPAQARPQPAQ
jgi:hypothetical protein